MNPEDYKIKFMKIALEEAQYANNEGEVPIGGVLVYNNKIISRNHNRNRQLNSPTAHAEILIIEEAAKKLKQFRLIDTDLFITIEPCPMCAGAIIYSRIKRVFFGAPDIKSGAAGLNSSVANILQNEKLNHRVEIYPNIMLEECKTIIQNFFKEKRA